MDRNHIAAEMERFISSIEKELGIRRSEIAQQGVYFSHETGTHSSPSSSCAANEVPPWMGRWVNGLQRDGSVYRYDDCINSPAQLAQCPLCLDIAYHIYL